MPTVESILSGLAEDRATGSLRLGKAGALYLTDGRVTYAESPSCPRVEDLLTTSGRVSAYAVRQARQAAGEGLWGGDRLVERGVLTRGELEFCVLGAVLDAVFFLLQASGVRPRFRPGERHWLGPQWYFDVTGLVRECRRRRAQLDQAWPSTGLDALPVVPLGRIPAQRVMLTSLQWEVLVGTDSTATPAELARKLGRPVYSVLLAVRQLAAAGLLRVPEPAPGAPDGVPAGTAPSRAAPSGAAPPGRPPELPPAAPAGPPAGALPRRADTVRDVPERGTGPSPGGGRLPQTTGDPADVSLLIRLRNALEALT
ncbi:DUF4388 domain-containing protein [Planomonospora venezuelensis]|uniref:PatA-like N-terminal domain-containing protein n=1 Tax=Planomonospora venezuelensis TaxID=1999 RepID=A0A841CWJ9_PLAVE|nr:DUF4388 domain-containing protein [Planomonospora venezuelensis]MBB5962291.1 hypothetical protein [Planomonospora venezuelensis]GIN00671.1 hypothetical protein Pve01_23290 [Planomonospora venezuelensis]